MPLAFDYRPNKFEEVAGNELTKQSLISLLKRERKNIPHALLFHGKHGCGKTTLGRIFARELGCHGHDYYEMDSAHTRGINAIREVRDSVGYPPMESSCRVWLFDECHKITKDGKDDLLKITEEPPEHAYFIFCTTDPQELPAMLKSRCVQFEVTPLSEQEMVGLLREIVVAEKKRVPDNVLQQIAQDSFGSCRDALMILEKIIDMNRQDMLTAAKRTAECQNQTIELCKILLSGEKKWNKVATILEGLKDENPEQVRQNVLGYAVGALKRGDSPKAWLILDTFLYKPFYNNGWACLYHGCYAVLNS